MVFSPQSLSDLLLNKACEGNDKNNFEIEYLSGGKYFGKKQGSSAFGGKLLGERFLVFLWTHFVIFITKINYHTWKWTHRYTIYSPCTVVRSKMAHKMKENWNSHHSAEGPPLKNICTQPQLFLASI